MATKPLTTEAIALTEKKMDMSLDDIIKMSKKAPLKSKGPPRPPIKSRGFMNGNASQLTAKVHRYIDSRSSIRQGVLAQRRSNFRNNQFQQTTEVAKKAAIMPIRNRVANWNKPRFGAPPVQRKATDASLNGKDKVAPKQRPQTLDARFADMKEKRMRAMMSQQMMRGGDRQTAAARRRRFQQQQQQRGGRGGGSAAGGNGRLFGNYAR